MRLLSRLRRSDAKRKKRLKASATQLCGGTRRRADGRGRRRAAEPVAAGSGSVRRRRRGAPASTCELSSGSSGSSGGGSSARLAFSTGTGASGSRGQFIPARPRTADQGYRRDRPRIARTAPAPTRPTVRYAATAVGAVEVAASPSGKLRHGPKRGRHILLAELTSRTTVGTAMMCCMPRAAYRARKGGVGAATRYRHAARRPRRRTPRSTTRRTRAASGASSPFSFSFSPSSEPV